MTHIAIIGFGEAAQAMAAGLSQEASKPKLTGYDIRLTDPAQAKDLEARAAERGITLYSDMGKAVEGADLVFSLVVGSAAVKVGEEAGKHLKPGQIFLDFNSISPDAKKRVGEALAKNSKAGFVEGAVMARVPPYKHKVPILLAGEPAEKAAKLMVGAGMDVEAVGTKVGQACAVKMIRSVMVKGVEALLLESLTAAEKAGVTERILDSIGGTFPGLDWRWQASYYLGRTHEHGTRRVTEMKEAAATLESLGVDPIMSRAIAERISTMHAKFKASSVSHDRPYQELLAALAGDDNAGGKAA